jgi:biopolymer transport protein ExbB/TolQ
MRVRHACGRCAQLLFADIDILMVMVIIVMMIMLILLIRSHIRLLRDSAGVKTREVEQGKLLILLRAAQGSSEPISGFADGIDRFLSILKYRKPP